MNPTSRIPPPALCVVVLLAACGTSCDEFPKPTRQPESKVDHELEWFTDQAQATGLDFIHFNGMSGELYMPEIMGSGVGMFDYDNDGDLDVYLVQGQMLGTGTLPLTPPNGSQLMDRLYRNDLELQPDGTRTVRFTDVTEESGIQARGYGQGIASGDIDNDGWVDLYLTRIGPNQMFRNEGNGTFTDVSEYTGTDDRFWGVPASFVDLDHDGWLDLFVGNYVHYSVETHVPCLSPSGRPDYCSPEAFRAQSNQLYRNRGDGTFVSITAAAGMAIEFGPALGIATADVNNDGWIDIFIANDQQENQLWVNQGDSTFTNRALLSGVALGSAGEAKADMGVDFGDFDNDGDEDLFITERTGQGSTLYVNDGTGQFEEQSALTGIRYPSLPYTGFGAAWIDFNNDGWLDILAVNGLIEQNLDALSPDNSFPFQQRNQLFRNLGNGQFEDVTDQAGAAFELSEVSRGAAFGDIDNDGDVDVLVSNDAGRARLLINNIGTRNHWLGLRLVGGDPPRDMVGARVSVHRSTGPTLWRHSRADGSYASANDPRVLVGLGSSAEAPRVRVIWPSGHLEEWADVPVDRYTTLTEGSGL